MAMTDHSAKGNRGCIHSRVRDTIVSRILDGTYAPGIRLKELALASEFQVSQAPVREALRELEALGLVEAKPYCGCSVRSADTADLREAYQLKMLIEEHSAILAVPCRPEDLAKLALDVEAMRQAAETRDEESFAVASLAFHRLVVVMSGNRQFLRAWDALLWPVRSRLATQRSRNSMGQLAEESKAIAQALHAEDGEGAGRLLRQMIAQFIAQHAAPL
jgi:DNA-binding GntR family transcriptional regulator